MVAVSRDVIVASPRRRVRARFSLHVKVVYWGRDGSDRDFVSGCASVISCFVSLSTIDGDDSPIVGGWLVCFTMSTITRHESDQL